MKYNDIERLNFYVLRTPSFPQTNIEEWEKDINTESFRKAIYLSSPDLYDQLILWDEKKLPKEKVDKMKKSLLKYWLRIHFRTIPFGTNAGVSMGQWDDHTLITLDKKQDKVHARLDMQVIHDIVELLEQKIFIRQSCKFYTNNTIYSTKNKYRYIEPSSKVAMLNYEVISTEKNKYLNSIIKACQSGLKLSSIIEILVNQDISYEDSFDYINELIDSKILVSELSPKVTDKHFQDSIYQFLKEIKIPASKNNNDDVQLITKLISIFEIVQEVNKTHEIGNAIDKIYQILNTIGIISNKKNILQTDLLKGNTSNSLHKNIFKDFKKVISLAFQIGTEDTIEDLENFKKAFTARYDQQEIPLLLALDPLSGINYPLHSDHDTPDLIEGIQFKSENTSNVVRGSLKWNEFLGKKLIDAVQNNHHSIQLTQDDLAPFLHENKNVPFSMSSLVQIYEDQEKQPIIFNKFTDGPSSSTFIGRFCHLDDQLEESVKAALLQEENFFENQIIAEIAHTPQPRVGNILLRPCLRKYEIPILTPHSTGSEPIYLNDLMISIKNDRIVLRSKKYNKEVIPSLSSAHNYNLHKVPLYHFLCDLQYQNATPSYSWNWGMFTNYDYLPRVMVNNVILSRTSWQLSYDKIFNGKQASINIFRDYLKERKIPEIFTFAERDMELPVFMNEDVSLEILLDHLNKEKNIRVFESLPHQYESIVKDIDGNKHSNEFLIPWNNISSKKNKILPLSTVKNTVIRNFVPGSKWLFYKIYCSPKATDQIIKNVICKFANNLIKKGIIKKWFFMRYSDPDHHIRLRFLTSSENHNISNQVYQLLDKYLTQEMIIHKIVMDTYNREIERYGESTIDHMESIFHFDSECVCSLLKEAELTETVTWKFAIVGVDRILDDFGYNPTEKRDIMNQLAHGYSNMVDEDSKTTLKDKYRNNRSDLLNLLTENNDFNKIVNIRTKKTASYIVDIRKLQSEQMVKSLVISYIHMFINRMFASKPNLYESILYYFLHKSYDSLLNMKKLT
ncbi:lantibiotic dehydratase [Chryseobacterium sp. BIGb0232]|uniref:lantibiotic dehydratase n=1 Tax=Chryseobacterium sp. BIGb0232 TaxID=2940598 RepID=UPI000F4735CF|nr:lantibiotic dehydratase [Chryseobacterium sp. BIGb0232]MCS4301684.1 thiopeptide-type bacteriocin biosynthesis protein [Chryseobacterium sp. BIGb0232]ROS19462.1 thiopeptide-type bacteriocin biosynthesis protein [Chryseobacterium nakagawai]